MKTRSLIAIAAAALLAGCTTTDPPREPLRKPDGQAVSADRGVILLYFTNEISPEAAAAAAQEFAGVRTAVAHELALDNAIAEVPRAEIEVARDSGSGIDYLIVTHAQIFDDKKLGLRVHIPCRLPPDENDGAAIAKRFRGTVAHEVAEATVLTHVPMLDPYLRWMHDGIAESVSFRVLKQLDAQAAADERERYLKCWRQARDKDRVRWVDLALWRQQSDWIVHSDSLFPDHRALDLHNLPESLARLGEERFVSQEEHPEEVATLDALADFLAETWARDRLAPGEGEVALHTPDIRDASSERAKATQFLCYGAAMGLWLELERGHPGFTGQVLAAIMARRSAVLRSSDVVKIIEEIAKVDVRPRLERFSFERLERVLAAER